MIQNINECFESMHSTKTLLQIFLTSFQKYFKSVMPVELVQLSGLTRAAHSFIHGTWSTTAPASLLPSLIPHCDHVLCKNKKFC